MDKKGNVFRELQCTASQAAIVYDCDAWALRSRITTKLRA